MEQVSQMQTTEQDESSETCSGSANDRTKNDVDLDVYDTPTQRATINQLNVDQLDAWLEQLRERRLTTVRKLEATARVKADKVRLESFLKYERAYKQGQAALKKIEEAIDRAERLVHKCRLLAMAAELEVGMEDDERAA